jgi:hypothetical protein
MWKRKTLSPLTRITKPTVYPADSAVDTGEEVYFITKTGSKLKVASPRVVQSWKFELLPGSVESLSLHKKAQGVLGFRNGTLIRNIADGKLYLVSGNKKRHIQSPDVFEKYGYDRAKIILVSQDEINIHEDGEVLS